MDNYSTVFEDRNNEKILGNKLDSHRINVTLADFFEISDKAQEGGMGDVYFCRDKRDNRFYVLKKAKKAEYEDIFRKEAELVLKLGKNPYVVYTKTIVSDKTSYYIVMEYIGKQPYNLDEKVEGETLTKVMNRTNIEPKQAVIWAIQFCKGMSFLNKAGIESHKDIKPDNILIDPDNNIKITDFGLVSIDKKCGTPRYRAPEYKEKITIQSDIYSFGLVLYQMLNGGNLLSTQTVFNKDTKEYEFVDGNKITSNHCQDIIKKCLQKEPSKRYKNFEKLEEELTKYLHDRWPEYTMPVLKAEPMTADDYFLKGLGYYVLSAPLNSSKIIDLLDMAIKLNPRYARAYYHKYLVLTSFVDRNYEESILHPISRYLKSRDLRYRATLRNLVLTMKKAIYLSPVYANLIGMRELREFAQAPYDEVYLKNANKCFLEVIKKDSKNPVGYNNIACLNYNYSLKIQTALNYLNKAISLNPNYVDAYYNRATIYAGLCGNKITKNGNIDCEKQALSDYNKAIKLNIQKYIQNPNLIICDDIISGKLHFLIDKKKFRHIIRMYDNLFQECNPQQFIIRIIKSYTGMITIKDKIVRYTHGKERYLISLYKKYFNYAREYYNSIQDNEIDKIFAENEIMFRNIESYRMIFVTPNSIQQYPRKYRYYDDKMQFYKYMCLLNKDASSYNELGFQEALRWNKTDALKYFNKALKIDSKYVNAYYNRGDANFYLHKYKKALSDYNRAIELEPDMVCFLGRRTENNIEDKLHSYIWKGNTKIYKGRISTTKRMVSVANDLIPIESRPYLIVDKNENHLQKGYNFNKNNNPNKAIEEFKKIINKNEEVYFQLGNSYYLLGKYNRAISYYKKCNEVNALFNISQCYKKLADTNKSNEYHKQFENKNKGVMINSNTIIVDYKLNDDVNILYHNAFWKRGMIKYAMEDYNGAIKDYLQAINIKSIKFSENNLWIMRLCRLVKERDPMKKEYFVFEEIKFLIYIYIGDAYYQLGAYNKALEYYQQAIQNNKFLHLPYTHTLFKLGRYKEAISGYLLYITDKIDIEECENVTSKDDEETIKQVYKNLMICYNAIGLTKEAQKYKTIPFNKKIVHEYEIQRRIGNLISILD